MHVPADPLHDPANWPEQNPDPPPPTREPISALFDQGASYGAHRPEGAGQWLLTYTLAGEGRFRQPGGIDFRVGPGDVVLLAPKAYSSYGTSGKRWCFDWVHFQPQPSWQPWLVLQRHGSGLHRASVTAEGTQQRLQAAFERLHRDLLERGPLAMELAMSALAEILLLINRELGQADQLDSRIERALELIHRAPAASHTVESLARAVSLSGSRFAHLFRRETGSSVMQTIHGVRLRQARRLLVTTEEPIGLIAESVGYNSAHYFSRHFKEQVGISPQQYRQQHR